MDFYEFHKKIDGINLQYLPPMYFDPLNFYN